MVDGKEYVSVNTARSGLAECAISATEMLCDLAETGGEKHF